MNHSNENEEDQEDDDENVYAVRQVDDDDEEGENEYENENALINPGNQEGGGVSIVFGYLSVAESSLMRRTTHFGSLKLGVH